MARLALPTQQTLSAVAELDADQPADLDGTLFPEGETAHGDLNIRLRWAYNDSGGSVILFARREWRCTWSRIGGIVSMNFDPTISLLPGEDYPTGDDAAELDQYTIGFSVVTTNNSDDSVPLGLLRVHVQGPPDAGHLELILESGADGMRLD